MGFQPLSPALPPTSRPPWCSPNLSAQQLRGEGRAGALTRLALGLTPLPGRNQPGSQSSLCLWGQNGLCTGLERERAREQAAKACFEYQDLPKIKKEKKERKVFWKHLMCQLIKCLIANKLPRSRGRGRRRDPQPPPYKSEGELLTPRAKVTKTETDRLHDVRLRGFCMAEEATNEGRGPRGARGNVCRSNAEHRVNVQNGEQTPPSRRR